MSVYFARVGRYMKVGYSTSPERRVANLWQSSTRYDRPWDLSLDAHRELLLVIPGEKPDERACHRALGDYYAAHEWFIDEPGVRQFMEHAERGDFPTIVRPGGPFVPVEHFDAPEERHEEMRHWLASRGKRYVRQTRAEAEAALARADRTISDALARRWSA